MSAIQQLRAMACADLCSRPDGRPIDPVVWEHSDRVARLTLTVAAMPEVANHVIDRTALIAAACYHDVDWLLRLRAGEIREIDLLVQRTSDRQRERAADWMSERLKNVLPAGTVQQAARIVRTCHQWKPAMIEALVLGEADNLDQIGPQAVWSMIRKQIAEGRSLVDLIQTWRRQEQYSYWPAWIRKCFHFDSARALAEQGYLAMRRFMSDLESSCTPDWNLEMVAEAGHRLPADRAQPVEAGG